MKRTIITCIGVITLFSMIVGCSNKDVANNDKAVSKQEINASAEESVAAASVEVEAVAEVKAEPLFTEKDLGGYLLFENSLIDALALTTDKIEVTQNAEATNYVFKDHIIRECGSHLEGKVIEDKLDGQLTYKASFNVSVNPYEITRVEVDAIKDETGTYIGTIIVDDKKSDISMLQF